MRDKRKRVDETVAHVANAVAQVRELSATLKSTAAGDRLPQLQILFYQAAALHRGAPILVAIQ